MNKGEWYRHLFGRIADSIEQEFFFEAAFISYGIIEDRLTSMIIKLGIAETWGVSKKINAIAKVHSAELEAAFYLSDWDGGKYLNLGVLGEVLKWGELYRNPMQHLLGDPRKYQAKFGGFHTQNSKDLAIEGEIISRKLSAAVMRFKKQ